LYEIACDGEGREFKSHTIMTTEPNEFMAEIHNRMPVILQRRGYEVWLYTSEYAEAKLVKLLRPWDGPMQKQRVSTRVNSVRNQGEELIAPENEGVVL
jgi:putative SOS response-associated peptidase YedK